MGAQAVLLQETFLQDWSAYEIARAQNYWQIFHCESFATTQNISKNKRLKPTGGVAVCVAKDIPAISVSRFSSPEGEFIRVATNQLHLVSAYRRPNLTLAEMHKYGEALAEDVAKVGPHKCFVAGDFNHDPRGDSLQAWAASLKAQCIYPCKQPELLDPNPTPFPIPTRWTGKVCLDWSIQLCCHLVPRVCEDKWGDHKMVAYQGHSLFQTSKPTARLGPQPDYSKPPDVPLESWVKALEKARDKNQPCEKNWYTFMNALDRTCTDALRQFLPEDSRRLRMAEKHNKQIQPCFSLQHNHHRVHATPGQSIKLARLRRLWRRCQELWSFPQRAHAELQQNISRDAAALGCEISLTVSCNASEGAAWIQAAISTEEERINAGRIDMWRRRLLSQPAEVWKRLARHRSNPPLTSIKCPRSGQALTGDNLTVALREYWQGIWPPPCTEERLAHLQQLADAHPWPTNPAPPLPPLTPAQLRAAAAAQSGKASGMDGWKGSEIMHLPDGALQMACDLFDVIEAGGPWPSQLCNWRQTHLQKPNKPFGELDSLRPISLSSCWYRLWGSVRMKQLADWIRNTLPHQQHGGIRRKSVATALCTPLTLLEKGMLPAFKHNPSSIRFMGSADLSKALDKLAAAFSQHSLARMGVPSNFLGALSRAWSSQARWLCTANSIATTPCANVQCLPQGDAASPLALNCVLAEAMLRVQRFGNNFPGNARHLHRLFLDDRSWFTSSAKLCAAIGRAWRHEMDLLNLSENEGKADYAATGGVKNQRQLKLMLLSTNTRGKVKDRPKILGTQLQLTRRHSGPSPEEAKRLKTATHIINEAASLPITRGQRLFFAKGSGLAMAVCNGWSRLPSLKDIRPLQNAIAKCAGETYTLGARGPLCRLLMGHTACPRFRIGFEQSLFILTTLDRELRACWPSLRRSQGPITLLRRWMQRQGFSEVCPWRWRHQHADIEIDARDAQSREANHVPLGPRTHSGLFRTPEDGKNLIAHSLREGWRAQQWAFFRRTDTKAAEALRGVPWSQAGPRAKEASKQWDKVPPATRPHVVALHTAHYVSQARFAATRGEYVATCAFCRNANPDRQHEWCCPALRTTARNMPDAIFSTLAWPRPGHAEDVDLMCEIAHVRQQVLNRRYGEPVI